MSDDELWRTAASGKLTMTEYGEHVFARMQDAYRAEQERAATATAALAYTRDEVEVIIRVAYLVGARDSLTHCGMGANDDGSLNEEQNALLTRYVSEPDVLAQHVPIILAAAQTAYRDMRASSTATAPQTASQARSDNEQPDAASDDAGRTV